jgi:hypothetical protein
MEGAEPIRVLQISDLLIRDRSSESLRQFLVEELGEFLGPALIDYMLLCGNITADGKDASFALAADLLQAVIERLLPAARHPDTHLANRILVLPGRRDLRAAAPPAEALAPFATFCRTLFGSFDVEMASCATQEVVLRELKDLTIIGVHFWNHGPTPRSGDHAEEFLRLLSRAKEGLVKLDKEGLVKLEYCRRTPTLLVSPESPLIGSLQRHKLGSAAIRKAAEEELGIDFHLFGASPIWCLPFEPFVFRHVALSTGPRTSRGPFPIRLNLLELSRRSKESVPRRPLVAVTSVQKAAKSANLLPEAIVAGSLDSVLEEKYTAPPKVNYREVFGAELALHLKDALSGCVALEYLPGQGMENMPLNSMQPEVILEVVKSYDKIFDLSERRLDRDSQTVRALLDAIHRMQERALDSLKRLGGVAREPPGLICVLRDEALPEILVDYRRKWLGMIREELKFLDAHRIPVVYATLPSDSSEEVRAVFKEPMAPPPLPDGALRRLLSFHGTFSPLQVSKLQLLCGSYVGLWDAMLDALEELFRGWAGAARLDAASLGALTSSALNHARVRNVVSRFRASMATFQGWSALYSHVREECFKTANDSEPIPVFSIQDIADRTGVERIRLEVVLEILLRLGVVFDPTSGAPSLERFTPGALLFFLHATENPRDPLSAVDPSAREEPLLLRAPHRFLHDAFISYRGREPDASRARDLAELLRRNGVTPVLDSVRFGAGLSPRDEVVRWTRQTRITVALVSEQYEESEFTEDERLIRRILDEEKRTRSFIPVLVEDLKTMPAWLNDYVRIDWISRGPESDRSVVERIKEALRRVRMESS